MEVSASKAVTWRYPLQFVCDLANAVLNGDIDKMLAYHRLISRCQSTKKSGATRMAKRLAAWPKAFLERLSGPTHFFIQLNWP